MSIRSVGRFPEAIALFEQSLAKQKAVPGPDATLTLQYMNCLAAAYQETGRFDRAEPLLVDVLAQRRKADRPQSDDTVDVLIRLGLNHLKQQKYAEAEPLLRECLKIREQNEPDDWTTFNTKSLLGGSLLGQKKYAEAEPLLLAGYEGMKQREEKIPPQAQGPPDRSHRTAGAALRSDGQEGQGRRVAQRSCPWRSPRSPLRRRSD